MKYFLGVDPGIHGAIAVLQENGRLIDVFDMPITKVKVGAGFKTRIVEARLQEILAPYTDSVGWVERVSAFVSLPIPWHQPCGKKRLGSVLTRNQAALWPWRYGLKMLACSSA